MYQFFIFFGIFSFSVQILSTCRHLVGQGIFISVTNIRRMTYVAWMRIVGRTVVAQIFAWIVARAAVVLAPAFAAAVVVEVAIAVAVEAFADRVQICFYAAYGLNGFSLQLLWPLARCKRCRWPPRRGSKQCRCTPLRLRVQ